MNCKNSTKNTIHRAKLNFMNCKKVWFIRNEGRDMMSIKEYATARNISYEAARQQVRRYAADIAGHTVTRNRTQYLDDVAINYLDEHRKGNPVVVVNQARVDEIARLRADNVALLQRVTALQDALIDAQGRAIEAAQQQARLTAAEQDRDRLRKMIDAASKKADEDAHTIADLQARAQAADEARARAEAQCQALAAELATERQTGIWQQIKRTIQRRK